MTGVQVAHDVRGCIFKEGQLVARAKPILGGASAECVICTVTKVQYGKVYLDHSEVAMKFPERLAILK